ncbi:hypothetical protein ACQ5SO_16655 [Rhodovulum sp. DZ06]|uniref:hypothetical protein n=1 Tax=Rhodovulum sp. DZ06 TaxID=3425126 RepID=UPI003D3338FD
MAKKPDPPSGQSGDASPPESAQQDCPLGELVVTVKDADGKLVQGAEVAAGAAGKKTTGADGLADFGKIDPGSYDVTADKAGHGPKKNEGPGKDEQKGVAVPEGGKKAITLIQHPSCANVAFFEGPTTNYSTYYGFDHRTNQVVTAGTDEYWLPTPAKGSLSLPGSRSTRDGARWVSIATGKTLEIEINFAFKPTDCIPCLKNTEFEVVAGSSVEVLTEGKDITSKKCKFKLKGKSVGESTVKVTCSGNVIGWVYAWVQDEAIIKIDVVNVITAKAPKDAWNLNTLRARFDEIFRQACLKVNIADLGDVDLTSDAALATTEAKGYPPSNGRFLAKTGSPTFYSFKGEILNAIHAKAGAALDARTTGAKPRAGAYRIYRYIPSVGCGIGGTVLNIGASPAFTMIPDGDSARNSIAHEFGHCLGLKHPSDGSSGPQYPSHLRDTTGDATPDWPATNTEPAIAARAAKGNVMANDPTNLMGYWPVKADRKRLRYLQWKALSRS